MEQRNWITKDYSSVTHEGKTYLDGVKNLINSLKLLKLSKTITDISLKVKIELTMLWYIYKGSNTSIEYIIRTYDKNGKEIICNMNFRERILNTFARKEIDRIVGLKDADALINIIQKAL
jgi:hypothetical protein